MQSGWTWSQRRLLPLRFLLVLHLPSHWIILWYPQPPLFLFLFWQSALWCGWVAGGSANHAADLSPSKELWRISPALEAPVPLAKCLLLCHLQSLLCAIIQEAHVISHRHLTEGTRSLGGGTYSSKVVELWPPPLWWNMTWPCCLEVKDDSMIVMGNAGIGS